MIGIPVGLIAANATEWVVHKYLLHNQGKKKGSFWGFHFHEHHKEVRKASFRDPYYERSLWGWNPQTKEVVALSGLLLTQLPLFPIAPFYVGTVAYCGWNYYRKHKRAHMDPEWAREHLPWHYDHHMGPNQDANWCVTRPWFDHIMGTREPYLGTEREARDRASRAKRPPPVTATPPAP